MKTDQIDVVAGTMLCDFQEINDTEKALTRPLVGE